MAFPTPDSTALIDLSDVPSGLGYAAVQNVHQAFELTTTMLAQDYVTAVFRMPAGVRYVSIYANADDMDTNGTPTLTLDIGVAGVSDTTYDDRNAILAASTIGQAGTGGEQTIVKAGAGLLVPVEHYITVTPAAGAATAAAGTLTLGIQAVIGENGTT